MTHPSILRTKINYNKLFFQISEFDLDAHKNKYDLLQLHWLGRFENLQRFKITLFKSYRPFTALYKCFLKYFTLTNKAVGTFSGDMSKPLQS